MKSTIISLVALFALGCSSPAWEYTTPDGGAEDAGSADASDASDAGDAKSEAGDTSTIDYGDCVDCANVTSPKGGGGQWGGDPAVNASARGSRWGG